MRATASILLIGMLLVLTGCPVTKMPAPRPVYLDEPVVLTVEGDRFVHEGSGMAFPTNIAGHELHEIVQFDVDGLEILVGYDLPPIASHTLYVYPGPEMRYVGASRDVVAALGRTSVQEHLEQVSEEIEYYNSSWKRVEDVSDYGLPLESTGASRVYSFVRPGFFPTPMTSEAHVFLVDDRWFFKVRSTYPTREREAARDSIVQVVEAVREASGGALK